jgi:hypothetical protein
MKSGIINNARPWILLLPAATILSACVTINIYFPAAAAEKAADRIIDEVWQIENRPANEQTPAKQPPAEAPAE